MIFIICDLFAYRIFIKTFRDFRIVYLFNNPERFVLYHLFDILYLKIFVKTKCLKVGV